MNIEKAIETGEQYRRDGETHDLQDFEDFIDLGIEALKYLECLREDCAFIRSTLLLGETEN